jgi:RNA polymerase sigma-70 factor (TIGR02960 family)
MAEARRASREGQTRAASTATPDPIDVAEIAAFQRGDANAFERLTRRYARELHVHCYRMVGSFDDADDLVQETFMRAWDKRQSYEGRAGIRAWLYRIATNACIDAIRGRAARGGAHREDTVPPYERVPWLQPYPDALLENVVSEEAQPDARLVSRDAIELAFLATVQTLPPKQRAVLIFRDVLDFSATETAEILGDTTAAVNSALQRARATLERRRGTVVSPGTAAPSFDDAVLLQAFMDAQDRGDVNALVDLLREDVRMTLFPDATTWSGRDAVVRELRAKRRDFGGDIRSVPIAANRQPALAVYVRQSTDVAYRAWAIVVLAFRDGKLREIATFASADLFARFRLPPTLDPSAA